jgi:hypothetical protein
MAKNAGTLWLDAIEAEESGDRDRALELSRDVVHIDPTHSDAWMMVARMELPPVSRGKQEMPDLKQTSKSMSALMKVTELDPDNRRAWDLGGTLMVDHLGMLQDALGWWERRRDVEPTETTPLIEQIAILTRMGYYEGCADLLEELFSPEMDAVDGGNRVRMERVSQTVARATKLESDEIFKPQQPKHPRWSKVEMLKDKKPVSETLWLFLFVAPFSFFIGVIGMMAFGNSTWGFAIVFLILLSSIILISRLTMGMLQRVNRHALDLERAIDFETSTGKVCIPPVIRSSKLYSSLIQNKMPAIQERVALIVESGEKMPSKWELELP